MSRCACRIPTNPPALTRDMVTHLFQVMAFVAMEPPTALEPMAISEKNKGVPVADTRYCRAMWSGAST